MSYVSKTTDSTPCALRISPDLMATMAYLRDAPNGSLGAHVAGRPDITGQDVQNGIRLLFKRLSASQAAADLAAAPVPTVKPTRAAKKGPASGTVGEALAALKRVMRAVATRTYTPVLACVRLSISGGLLTITATDTDRWIEESVPCNLPDMVAIIPAKELRAVLAAADQAAPLALNKAPDVTTKDRKGVDRTDPGPLRVGSVSLGCLSPDDFPVWSASSLAKLPAVQSFSLPAETLVRLFSTVEGAISTEETRYFLNGINLRSEGDKLTATATDGHRLLLRSISAITGADFPGNGIIIPRAVVDDVIALFGKTGGSVAVECNAKTIRFSAGSLVIVSKLIDGEFPDFRRVIPRGNENLAEFDTADMIRAVKACKAIQTDRRTFSVKLSIDGSLATVSAVNVENGGTVCEPVKLVKAAGFMLKIGFNSGYLLDMLSGFGPAVTIAMSDSAAAAVFTDTDAEKLGVIMPMRV